MRLMVVVKRVAAERADAVVVTADRVAVLKNGKLVEFGDAAQVFTNPQEQYTRTLLEAVPAFSA